MKMFDSDSGYNRIDDNNEVDDRTPPKILIGMNIPERLYCWKIFNLFCFQLLYYITNDW